MPLNVIVQLLFFFFYFLHRFGILLQGIDHTGRIMEQAGQELTWNVVLRAVRVCSNALKVRVSGHVYIVGNTFMFGKISWSCTGGVL